MKSIWIPVALHKALKKLAVDQDSDIQTLAEAAVREYLERRNCQLPPKASEAALAAAS